MVVCLVVVVVTILLNQEEYTNDWSLHNTRRNCAKNPCRASRYGSQINVVDENNSRTAKRKRKRGFDACELLSFASTMHVVFPICIFGTIRGAPSQRLRSGFSTHHDNPHAPKRQEMVR